MTVTVVGGGLAGCEAAWQLAERGHEVRLIEMRPVRTTPAHATDRLAELVCSNTFKSTETSNAHGLLKAEMRRLGSMVLQCADEARVPAGSALAVDRERFADGVTARIEAHPRIVAGRKRRSGAKRVMSRIASSMGAVVLTILTLCTDTSPAVST